MKKPIAVFILFIIHHCLSASIAHDDIEIVDTKAKSEMRVVEGRMITGDDCEYIKLCEVINNAGCDDGKENSLFSKLS